MKQTRDLLKNSGSTQAMRFIQSFSNSELDASNPKDWQKANQMGKELAQKIAPDNQFAIYTHIDGKGHKLHNHLVMNMPDLKTGKKYHQNNDWERVTKLNDEVIKSHGLIPLDPARSKQVEKKTMAERQLQAKNEYVWKDDLRNQIDKVMVGTENSFITSKNQFSDVLKEKGIIYHERGKNSCSFEFKDKNNKLRRIRGKNLGDDYTKGAIENGLESNKITRNVEIAGEVRPDKREFNELNRNLQRQEFSIGDPIRRGERQHSLIATQTKKESEREATVTRPIDQFNAKFEQFTQNIQGFIRNTSRRLKERLTSLKKPIRDINENTQRNPETEKLTKGDEKSMHLFKGLGFKPIIKTISSNQLKMKMFFKNLDKGVDIPSSEQLGKEIPSTNKKQKSLGGSGAMQSFANFFQHLEQGSQKEKSVLNNFLDKERAEDQKQERGR